MKETDLRKADSETLQTKRYPPGPRLFSREERGSKVLGIPVGRVRSKRSHQNKSNQAGFLVHTLCLR